MGIFGETEGERDPGTPLPFNGVEAGEADCPTRNGEEPDNNNEDDEDDEDIEDDEDVEDEDEAPRFRERCGRVTG